MLAITQAELDQLRALAAERAVAVSTYAYELLRAALKRRRKPGAPPKNREVE